METNIVIFNAVSLHRKTIFRLLPASPAAAKAQALLSCIFTCIFAGFVASISACSDIPDIPDRSAKIQSVDVFVSQFGENFFEPLKVNSKDTATLVADVAPHDYKDSVKYYWYNGDSLLDSGSLYTVPPASSRNSPEASLPDRIVIDDGEGNSLEKSFTVTVNAPPEISDQTVPAEGDTLYGDAHTPLLFSWSSYDSDFDDLSNTLVIDGEAFSVGPLNRVLQSGLGEGTHTFTVIVEDPYGDRDSLPRRVFVVVDTLGVK